MAKSKVSSSIKAADKPMQIVAQAQSKGKEKVKEQSGLSAAQCSAVKSWINMVVNPLEAQVVRSPASNSVLASKARFVESRDIAYADTLNGYFTVVARPSAILPLVIAKSPLRFPSAGSAELKSTSEGMVFPKTSLDAGFPHDGTAVVRSASDMCMTGLQLLADAASVAHYGFELFANTGTNFTCVCSNSGNASYYVRLYYRASAGNWATSGSTVLIGPYGSAALVNGNIATNWSGITFAVTDKSGAPVAPDNDYKSLHFTWTYNGYIPVAASSGSVFSFVTPTIAETAGVDNCRITAMSLLVTNMGAATHDGGEIVVADTRQANIYSAHTTAELMDTIKSLPEGNRWNSGVMRGGAYTFYVPDDMSSYEPHKYTDSNFQDNACVAAGKLDVDGSVRVIATYVVEFYTKSQLFERSMGPTWTNEYKLAHQYLQRGRMASGNEDHETMTRRIANNLARAWKWAWEHRSQLELGAEVIMSLL